MSRFIQSVVYHKKLIGCKYMCNSLVSQIFEQFFWVSRFLLCVKNDVRGKCSALLPTARGFTQVFACVKPKFEDSPEGLYLTCEAPSRSEGSPKGFPRYGFRVWLVAV